MKKPLIAFSILFALVSSSIFNSCKNEEKSKLLDSASVIPAKDTQNLSLVNKPGFVPSIIDTTSKTPIAETGIYKSEDNTYHLRYILEKGKVYPFNTRETNTQTLTIRGESQTISMESKEPLSFTVLDIKDGKYVLQVHMGGKKVITKADGQQSVFDTNGQKPSNPDQAKMWKIYKAISNITFTMNMDIYGNVSNINGLDAVYSKAKSALTGDLKGKELDDFVQAFKKGFNAEIFKAQFESSIMKFPSQGLKIGEKWNNNPSMKGKGYNELVKVDENYAEVKLQGNIPSQSESKVLEGVTYKISVKGFQNGKVTIDTKSGWITKGVFTVSVTETRSAKKGEESEQAVQKTVNNTYIN
ncbi:DUF6263 family protein [Apibacter raozihei]|uniref:DUF6263 family protein n=1 Tax=Apibacter TaxID=1778601 RepID=UPI000FE360CF|nr:MULTISPECIES: DUF6263 family protein [Apibacter]